MVLHQHADLGAEQTYEFAVYIVHDYRNAQTSPQVHWKERKLPESTRLVPAFEIHAVMDLEDKIAAIAEMSPSELRAAWRDTYGMPAPPALGRSLLRRALAARLQEAEAGRLTQVELRQLCALGRKDERRKEGRVSTQAKPGTWLSRTWHGEVHEVVVLESGCEYRGQTFGSLSAVASHITGAKWSGPRFFGLSSPRLGEMKVAAHG